MTVDSTRVVFHLDPDPLLIGVLRSAVQFQVLHSGLGEAPCAEFAKATEDVCLESISKQTEIVGGLDITLETFSDRIEVSIRRHGQTIPAVGLESSALSETPADEPGRFNGLELLSRADRVLFSTEVGVARTTLVKFLHPKS